MTVASVAEVESHFSTFLKASEAAPVVVTRDGQPVALIVGVHDQAQVQVVLKAKPRTLQEVLEISRKQFEEGNFLTSEEFWKMFGLSSKPPKPKRARAKRKPSPLPRSREKKRRSI